MKQTEKFSASPSLSKEYGCSVTSHKDAFIRLDIACTGCEWFDMSWLFHSARWYSKKIATDGSSKKIFAHYKLFTTAHFSTLSNTDLIFRVVYKIWGLPVKFAPSVHLSACTHEKTRQPLNGFSRNLMLVTFNKICERRRLVVEIDQNRHFIWYIVCIHTLSRA